MTITQASAAVGRRVAVDPDSLFERDGSDRCGFADVAGGPEGLTFMVNRNSAADEWKIVRLDIIDGPIATGGGIRIGATEAEVKQVYGERLAVRPHEYTGDEGGHYLVLDVDGTGGLQLLFETDGAKVLTYRSGYDSAVQAPEGCA